MSPRSTEISYASAETDNYRVGFRDEFECLVVDAKEVEVEWDYGATSVTELVNNGSVHTIKRRGSKVCSQV